MKTSKLLITSLLAAAAMSAIPAWADVTVTQNTTNATSGGQALGAISFSGDYTYTWNINAWGTATVSGISGTGTLSIERREGGGNAQVLKLSGTNTDFTGTIAVKHSDTYTTRNVFLALQEEDAATNVTISVTNYGGLLLSGSSITASNVKIAGLTGDSTGVVYATTIDTTTGSIPNGNAALTQNGTVARTLIFTGSDTYVYAGTIGSTTNQSSLNLTKSGTGTQTLSGTTYLGNLDVSGGNLVLSGTANIAGTTTVSGGELSLSGTVTLASSAISVGDGASVTVSRSTVFVLTDALKASGSENTWTLISGTGTVNGWNASTLNTEDNFRKADGSYFGGRSELDFSTAGTVTITDIAYDLYWKGGTTGTWDKTTASNFGKDSTTGADTEFVAGDNVTFSSSATVAVSEGIRAGVVSITGTVDAPTTLTLSNQANLTAKSINIASGAKLDLGSFGNDVNVVHHLTGSGEISFQKTGSNHDHRIDLGTEFTGTINYGGTLNPTNAILGAAAARVNFTNVDFWSNGGSATLAQTLNFSGESNKTRGGTLTLSGPISFSENSLFKVEAGTLNISGSVTDASITQTGGTLNISLSRDSTIKSLTQTSGSFNVTSGTTKFQGDSSITRVINYGTTRVENGATLSITGAGTGDDGSQNWGTFEIGSGASVNVAADFDLSAWADRNSANDIPKTLTVGENGSLTVAGKVRNRTGLTLTNDGTISVGTFYYASGATDSVSGSGVIAADKFEFSNHGTYNFSGVTLEVGSGGIQADATANNNYGFNLNFGAVKILLTANSETAAFTVHAGYDPNHYNLTDATTGTTYDTNGFSMSILQAVEGSGKLVKAGAGTLTLSGNNTFTGGTVIEAGTVVAAHASALGTTKGVEVQSGATLNLGTSAVTVAGLSGAGSVGLANGTTSSTLTVDSATDTDSTFSGSISGDMSVVKTGAGTQEFSGVFTLLGESDNAKSVSVQEGMLKLHLDTGSTPLVGSISVSSGSSLGVVASSNSPYGVAATTDNGYTYDGSISFDVGGKLIVDLNSVAVVDGATEIALKILSSSVISFAGTDLASMTLTDATLGGFVEFIDTNGVFNEFQKSWVYETDGLNVKTLSLTMTIPEPSVFGLLAGLGALALAGTRRRRKKA